MVTQHLAIILMFASFIAVASAQLIAKARFGAIGLASETTMNWQDAIPRLLGDPLFWFSGMLVIVGAVAWYLALTRLPVSFMLLASALIAPMVLVGAHVFLGEELGWDKVAATVLITAGVVWLWLD